jgi:hypothetical protein
MGPGLATELPAEPTVGDAVRLCADAPRVPREVLDRFVELLEELIPYDSDAGYEVVADGYTLHWWSRGYVLLRSKPRCLVARYINAGGETVEWAVVAE